MRTCNWSAIDKVYFVRYILSLSGIFCPVCFVRVYFFRYILSRYILSGYILSRYILSGHVLKSSFSAPKIMHTLSCSPCFGNEALEQFDSLLRSDLCTITNLAVSNHQWIQTSLPVSAGGLWIRRVVSLALPAFLASAASTHSLQSLLLPNCHCRLKIDSNRERLMRTWTTIYNTNTPGSPGDTKQSVWDRPGIMADQAVAMSAFTDNFNRARLLAASAPHSGDWLHALLCQHAG